MRSKQLTQAQEEYQRFDKHRQVANRIILILFVAILVCVAVSWHLANITYVPAMIITSIFLAYSVVAYFYIKSTKKKHDLLYAEAYGASVEVTHNGLFGELWEEFEYNQFEGLTDGKMTYAATGGESIELNILRNKREYIIEIDSKALYMIVDEETNTPIEKEIPLYEFTDIGEVFVAIRDFVEN